MDKTSTPINFSNGLETFTNKNEIQIGQFVSLQNTVFVKTGSEGFGALQKRSGYNSLVTIPAAKYLTTFRDSLVSVGESDVKVFSSSSGQTISAGYIKNLQLNTVPIVRGNNSPANFDCSLSTNGALLCTAYTESNTVSSGASTPVQKVVVSDVATGAPVFGPANLNNIIGSTSNVPSPQVYTLGNNFVIAYHSLAAGSASLFLTTVSQTIPTALSAPLGVSSTYAMQTVGSGSGIRSFDGLVASNTLFLAWGQATGTTTGQLAATSFNSTLTQGGAATVIGSSAGQVNHVTLAVSSASVGSGTLFAAYSSANVLGYGNQITYSLYSDYNFHLNASAAVVQNGGYVRNLGSYLGDNAVIYSDQSTRANVIGSIFLTRCVTIFNVSLANVWDTRNTVLQINAGLSSKPFIVNREPYFLTSYSSAYQSTYFICNSAGGVVGKFAYGEGPGYVNNGIPQVSTLGSICYAGYLSQFISTPVNKATNVSSTTQISGIYSQLGANLCKIDFSGQSISTIETAGNLHVNGAQVWNFDGAGVAEHNFHLYPEILQAIEVGGGTLAGTQNFFYTACYKYIDNSGNVYRSAPAIPVSVSVIGSNSAISLFATNLGQTLKSAQIFFELYRWSSLQQTYYLVASLNNTTNRFGNYSTGNSFNSTAFQYFDTNTDASIIGNQVLYTNGGVVEDSGPPACNGMVIFDSRFWLIDSEDQNLLWYSKSLIEATPVEMSDLLTYFIPPTISGQAVAGPMKCLATMDDKLVIFKKDTILYINGTGPDDTGANSQYSQPIIITNGVGCTNQNSIVFTPLGLLFQSDKGIWLLGRDLSVKYIGQAVDLYSSATVKSALLVPGTTQVRFTLDNGVTLMYDYLANQWGTFNGIPGVSACIYNKAHTYLASSGSVSQETAGSYADNGVPVTMQFQTGFVNLGGMQSYVRAYRSYWLANFKSPHTYSVSMAYDFDPTILQTAVINPTNVVGSGSQVEQWQVNFARQQCQSFQMTFQETASGSAGAGLTLSDMNIYWGGKKTYPRNISPKNRTG